MSKEAFVYRWYDAPNDMYYLGKHKGSPDDKYTHSSAFWESFTKDNIPKGVTREIIAYGTDEEMCILEHKLLKFAKENGIWDKYYNVGVGDPRYVDMHGKNNPMYGVTGENHPSYKHGRCGLPGSIKKKRYDITYSKSQGKPKEEYGGKSYRQVYYEENKEELDKMMFRSAKEWTCIKRIEKLIILLENEKKRFGHIDDIFMDISHKVERRLDYISKYNLDPEILLSYDLFDKY